MDWKPDWKEARANLSRWWACEGPAFCIFAPLREPRLDLPKPERPSDDRTAWTDPAHRAAVAEYQMAGTFFGGEAFPYFDTQIGPGSLALFVGSEPGFAPSTVWYKPCIRDPETYGPIRFDPANRWFRVHMDLIREALRRAEGRYLAGIPDVVENIDILAAMRDPQTLLLDLIERPEWVEQSIREINDAYFASFDLMYEQVKDGEGGNAFSAFRLWGPGRTAKVQCDFCCMISPPMFDRFVVPCLSEQCDWLDYSMYHLDGVGAWPHLDALLAIPGLNAIQWTPGAGKPGTGDPCWYDLYRRIRAAGKGVQALGVEPEHLVPLIETVGPEGLFASVYAPDQDTAESLLETCRQYR
jgi:hypothetical protein